MSFKIQDPLFLLSEQTGLSVGELAAEAADASPDVNKPQEPIKTGEPIPVVFCRFRNSNGGVMIQPKITEGSFANDIAEETFSSDNGSTTFVRVERIVRIKYLLVLSEGCLPLLQIRDLFYGDSRKGTFNQACNARAGTWAPGNFWDDYIDSTITPVGGYYPISFADLANGEAARAGEFIYYKDSAAGQHVLPYIENTFPVFCGTSGSYSGLTTLSFEYEADAKAGDAGEVLKGISAFVRSGLQVTRLADDVTGESDNFADLVKYLLTASDRLAVDLIDNASLVTAAKFTDANGFLFNGAITKSENLLDWIQATSKNFLLRLSNSGGKIGLLPRLPYNTDFTIKTTQVTPEYTFTEDHIVPDGFEIEYISLKDREPVCFNVQWRQQPEADFGLVRTVAVRYNGEAPNGPFISIDMSNYCTDEDHAVKVGAFYLARRRHIAHHLRLTVREGSYSTSLVIGDLVRVRLRRETSEGRVEYHDKLYEINRIEKTFDSVIVYDLTHFPIDSQGRSIVALEFDAASGAGNVIDVGRSTFDGDENSSTSTATVGTSSGGGGNPPDSGDTSVDIEQPSEEDSPFPDGPNNPDDPLEDSLDDDSQLGHDGSGTRPIVGDNAVVPRDALSCDGRVCFYRLPKGGGTRELKQCVNKPISGDFTSSITTDDIDHYIVAVGQCPDDSSSDGFGAEIDFGQIGPAEPDTSQYSYVRFKGTTQIGSNTPSQITTDWTSVTSSIGLRGLFGCLSGATPITGASSDNVNVGPCDSFRQWRSAVWAVAGVASGGTLALGGITDHACGGSTGGGAFLRFGGSPVTNITYRIVGVWEFSNDQSTIEVTWTGDRDDEQVPANAIPGSADPYSCS